MMKLYFRNCYGTERLIAECQTVQEVHKEIKKFLDEHNCKSYYSRSWKEDNGDIVVDVGSYTEFFIIKDISFEEYMKSFKFYRE